MVVRMLQLGLVVLLVSVMQVVLAFVLTVGMVKL